MPPSRTTTYSYSCKLTDEQRDKLVCLLHERGYPTVDVPYTILAVDGPDCRISIFKSGKLLVQGRGTEEFVLYTIEPEITGVATLGYEEALQDPRAMEPHMGIDESGKGDFFGPLVACAAYTDPNLAKRMAEIGVKDCKLLSDKQVHAIGMKLRGLLGPNRFKLVTFKPENYNRGYARFHNVNSILSWAHARCIENLLESMPGCPRAVADQFGAEHLIRNQLMEKGRQIVLEQHHKAESDIAVAAASILAREHFLNILGHLSEECGVELPKGASNAVIDAGVSAVNAKGPAILASIAKCHFRTTDTVLERCGKTRADIGPLGAAVSRPYGERRT